MALKPTIYKTNIILSDLNRDFYDNLNLTIAQHPSETLERMMVRLLALCINAQEGISFTKGLSSPDEPDIWARTLDDQLALWIDVGEPTAERIKKATRIAQQVKIYSFNSKSNAWWNSEKNKFKPLSANIYQFDRKGVLALTQLAQRTMELSITITEDSAYITGEQGECEVSWLELSH